jgi:hypothetical protein
VIHPEEEGGVKEVVYGPYLGSLKQAAGPMVGDRPKLRISAHPRRITSHCLLTEVTARLSTVSSAMLNEQCAY